MSDHTPVSLTPRRSFDPVGTSRKDVTFSISSRDVLDNDDRRDVPLMR